MARQRLALSVSGRESEQARALYLAGERIADIARQLQRSESSVYRAVRGLKRPRPRPTTRNADRDAKVVEMRRQGASYRAIGIEFGISATRACDIVRASSRMPAMRPPAVKVPPPGSMRGPSPAPKLTRAQLARRNKEIARLRAAGLSYARLAGRFALSIARVKVIVQERRRRARR